MSYNPDTLGASSVYFGTQFFTVIIPFLGDGAQKAFMSGCLLSYCPKLSSKDSNQRTSHWLPALTMTGTPVPEKSLETQGRRPGPNFIIRILVQGRRGGESEMWLRKRDQSGVCGRQRDHKPRSAGSLQKLEKAKSRLLPRSLQKEPALPIPWF